MFKSSNSNAKFNANSNLKILPIVFENREFTYPWTHLFDNFHLEYRYMT